MAETISWVSSATWSRSSDPGTPVTIRLPRSILGAWSVPSRSSTSVMSQGPSVRQSSTSSAVQLGSAVGGRRVVGLLVRVGVLLGRGLDGVLRLDVLGLLLALATKDHACLTRDGHRCS